MYSLLLVVFVFIGNGDADPVTEVYKNQYCTDPRTLKRHPAYSEWADAYSCTRHRCQPGGRNLAIYTVGCKRVEAPESAIECEEVVEDTNMQFPFCCTRLRCLVVVRGEVWTKVLGQPWETLPAAPWSHMYKMKRPPPADEPFPPKTVGQGPVYELQDEASMTDHDQVLRSAKKNDPYCKDCAKTGIPPPDIVIALATGNEDKKLLENTRAKNKIKGKPNLIPYVDENTDGELFDAPLTEKVSDNSEEKMYPEAFRKETLKKKWKGNQSQWNQPDAVEVENIAPREEKSEKTGLQALVDAIGNRMRDIENVVQRMSQKVSQNPEMEPDSKDPQKIYKLDDREPRKPKKPSPDGEHYNRFSIRNRGSKYLRTSTDITTELPLFVEDTNLNNGYFVDASNTVLKRTNVKEEPVLTYMAPVENTRRYHASEDGEKKKKKHTHKKKKGKGKGHKKHHAKEEKKKHFNKINSIETDKSIGDSSSMLNI